MDLHQPPNPKTEIVASITNQELENFDSELAALCNGIKTPRQNISKNPGMMVMADLLKGVESNSEIYQQRLQETAQLRGDFIAFKDDNSEKLSLLTKQFESVAEQITITTTAMQQENLQLIQRLQSSEQTIETLRKEVEQIHDNQVNINQDHIENLESSQFQFKCIATGVIGFLAGFLIWFYAHKSELLR